MSRYRLLEKSWTYGYVGPEIQAIAEALLEVFDVNGKTGIVANNCDAEEFADALHDFAADYVEEFFGFGPRPKKSPKKRKK